jgi:4-diphosphocytidyl-2-C-methyl-D-erythritol kinase
LIHPGAAGAAELVLLAPAKLNLSLEILRRRTDGYHDIASVMQAIDLADHVRVRVEPGSGIEVEVERASPAVERAEIPAGPGNLAWRAAAAGLEAAVAAGGPAGARVAVHLTKRIPVAAGLGGGSADAAAVLLGLNALCGRPLGAAALYRLAARLGSDVPFFLAGGTCLATGRGELLRRLPPLPAAWVVVVAPRVPVETQWAYAARSSEGLTGGSPSASILESAIRQRSIPRIADALVNDLERVVARRYEVVAEVLEGLREGKAIGARMSGSGSSAYGLVEDRGEALRLAEKLRRLDHPVSVCRLFRRGATVVPAEKSPGAAPPASGCTGSSSGGW